MSVLGNNVGLGFLVVAVAFGVGALITASEVAFVVLKAVGAAYLIYLGVQVIRHRGGVSAGAGAVSHRRVFRQSLVVGFTNPKTLAFYVAVLPQFVRAGAGPTWLQLVGGGVLMIGVGGALAFAENRR